jgi:hypothetical protein
MPEECIVNGLPCPPRAVGEPKRKIANRRRPELAPLATRRLEDHPVNHRKSAREETPAFGTRRLGWWLATEIRMTDFWSGRRDSNPLSGAGKLLLYP